MGCSAHSIGTAGLISLGDWGWEGACGYHGIEELRVVFGEKKLRISVDSKVGRRNFEDPKQDMAS